MDMYECRLYTRVNHTHIHDLTVLNTLYIVFFWKSTNFPIFTFTTVCFLQHWLQQQALLTVSHRPRLPEWSPPAISGRTPQGCRAKEVIRFGVSLTTELFVRQRDFSSVWFADKAVLGFASKAETEPSQTCIIEQQSTTIAKGYNKRIWSRKETNKWAYGTIINPTYHWIYKDTHIHTYTLNTFVMLSVKVALKNFSCTESPPWIQVIGRGPLGCWSCRTHKNWYIQFCDRAHLTMCFWNIWNYQILYNPS